MYLISIIISTLAIYLIANRMKLKEHSLIVAAQISGYSLVLSLILKSLGLQFLSLIFVPYLIKYFYKINLTRSVKFFAAYLIFLYMIYMILGALYVGFKFLLSV